MSEAQVIAAMRECGWNGDLSRWIALLGLGLVKTEVAKRAWQEGEIDYDARANPLRDQKVGRFDATKNRRAA